MAFDNTAPVAIAHGYAALTGDAPVGIAPGFTPNNGAPVALATTFVPDATPPEEIEAAAGWNNAGAVPVSLVGQTPLPSMPAQFVPAFDKLTGGGLALDVLTASAADIGKVIQGTHEGALKSYRVTAGADAAALPGIVRPANFHAVDNAVLFVQC